MLLPMETLSLPTTRTDSGTGGLAPPRLDTGQSNKRFSDVFEKELTRHDQRVQNNNKPPGRDTEKYKSVRQGESSRSSDNKRNDVKSNENGEAGAAGVQNPSGDLGKQIEEVVFVLEGEESVATPTVQADNAGWQPELNQQMQETLQVTVETEVLNEVKTDIPETLQHSEKSETTPIIKEPALQTDKADASKAEANGEVTARMPDTVSDNKEANAQSDRSFQGEGNPGPLEKENEIPQVKGQQEENYQKAAEAAVSKAGSSEEESKPAVAAETQTSAVPPPLTMGLKPEIIRADAQMTQAAANTVKPENLFEEMIQRVETMQNAEKSTMSIQLNPQHLGKVILEVGVDTAGVHVKINAEDSNIKNMINTQIATLIESLESKGLAVSEVEVVLGGANFDNYPGPNNGREQSGSQKQTGKITGIGKAGIESYNNITDIMDYYLDAGISSVEYSA